jgi:hypothetical protein
LVEALRIVPVDIVGMKKECPEDLLTECIEDITGRSSLIVSPKPRYLAVCLAAIRKEDKDYPDILVREAPRRGRFHIYELYPLSSRSSMFVISDLLKFREMRGGMLGDSISYSFKEEGAKTAKYYRFELM